jgi:parvulin-like peptidyl-prolyl isomerase
VKKALYIIGTFAVITALGFFFGNVYSGAEDKTVAIVNGEKISSAEVEKKIQRYKDLDPNILPVIRKEIIDEMVIQALIGQFLKKEKINISNEEVEKSISGVRERMKANPRTANFTLEELLDASGSNIDELKQEIKTSLGLKTYFEKITDEKTLTNYFTSNKEMYGGEMVKASHILVDTRLMESPEEMDKARQKIEGIKKELDGGADFAELAKKYSDCPSSEKGGDIGYFPRKGAVVEPFAQVAFSLVPGQVSEPVKTEFGYHIIKVTDKKEAKAVNYADVKEQVKENYIEEETGKLVQKLRQEAKIEITEP